MTDKKLTDSEIVKALECKSKMELVELCYHLQAENEALTKNKENLAYSLANAVGQKMTAKAEAYKEFAERLKMRAVNRYNEWDEQEYPRSTNADIDNLLKELVGEDNTSLNNKN